MIKVLIADDYPLLRKMLKLLISEAEDIVVAGEVSDGEEVLEKVKENNFNVILLDINLPKKNGLEVLKELRSQGEKISALIVSTHSYNDYGELVIREGASGYIAKEEASEKLIDAIRNVSRHK
ncbi:MAG: response regulator transcription factor [Thermodesulfovibrionales bacterium]|nr:response regulator transcription factor [Thermodesulfovibrionales bacterium]